MTTLPIGKLLTLVWFSILAFIVVFKAIHIPITYDEQASAIFYPRMSIGDIMANVGGAWPNNHILNSLLIKISENIFGISAWSVRLPNVLSFFLLAGTIYTVAKRFFSRSAAMFFLLPVVLLADPYLLDFYSLARGYGLSNALMAASLAGVLLYLFSGRIGSLYFSIPLAALAVYANFTLLVYWAALHILLVPVILVRVGPVRAAAWLGAHMICCAGALLCISYRPIADMTRMNRFIYFSDISFFHDTIADQTYRLLYGQSFLGCTADVLGYIFVGIFALALLRSFFVMKHRPLSFAFEPLVFLTLLLLLVACINLIQKNLFHTPYLNNRTALCYYVLFAFVVCFLVRDGYSHLGRGRNWIVAGISFLFLANFARAVNLRSVFEWSFDAYTHEVIDYLEDYRSAHPAAGQIEMDATWLFLPSFQFYKDIGRTPWLKLMPEHRSPDTASQALFYYATGPDAAELKNYRIVKRFLPSDQVLMLHD